VQGNEITPSTFNIFRDSFKKTFTEIRDTLKMNLPDLKLDETSESDDNEEVVPLDFRTKLMGDNGDVVMQAKPLKIYDSDEDDGISINDILKQAKENKESKFLRMSADDYLQEYRKEAFKDDDENVILIQPNTNIKEKLAAIDLECNKYSYLNNAIDAPKAKTKPPKVNKTFKQDEEDMANMQKISQLSKRKKKTVTINDTPIEGRINRDPEVYQPPSKENDLLDFDSILASQGVDLDDLLGEGEESKTNKKEPIVFNQNTIMQLLTMSGLKDEILNSVNKKQEEEQDEEPQVDENDTSENESAPVGALVDDVQDPEQIEQVKLSDSEKKEFAFRRSVVEASSASEDERGFSHSKHPGLSSDEELIDTSSKPQSFLSGQAIKPASTAAPSTLRSSGTGGDLFLPINPVKPRPQTASTYAAKAPLDLAPDSLLFKKPAEGQNSNKILYRGVWIESNKNSKEEEDTEDADRHYFNTQRELMKKRLRESKNNEFGDVDKLQMENVGVEIVDKQRFVKVERDWGESMTQFDGYRKKEYKEDQEM
jgi:hypothetical protein